MTDTTKQIEQYRKKPVVIEAVQLTEQACWDNWLDRKPVFGKFSVNGNYHPADRKIYSAWVVIETLEGAMRADLGDWIIKGVKGEFYPCKPDIFAATYEAAATPSPVPAEQDDDAMIVKAVQDAKVWCVVPTADTTRDIGRVVLAAERKRVAELVPAEPATAELPPLPNTNYNGYSDGSEPLYTADQMRDYARATLASRPAPVAELSLNDVSVLRRWAEQIERMAGVFSDERDLLCQQVVVLMHRIAYQPDQSAQEVKCACGYTEKECTDTANGEPLCSNQGAQAGQWVRCTPNLILAGVDCAKTPRRDGDGTYSHDHFIAHTAPAAPSAAQAAVVPVAWRWKLGPSEDEGGMHPNDWRLTATKPMPYIDRIIEPLVVLATPSEGVAAPVEQNADREGYWPWERRAEAAEAFMAQYITSDREKTLGDYPAQPIIRRLAAAILEWQKDAIKHAPEGVCGTAQPSADQVASEAAVRDAARYRWIRQFGYQAHELIFHGDGTLMWTDDMDAAIDAAMLRTSGEKGSDRG